MAHQILHAQYQVLLLNYTKEQSWNANNDAQFFKKKYGGLFNAVWEHFLFYIMITFAFM